MLEQVACGRAVAGVCGRVIKQPNTPVKQFRPIHDEDRQHCRSAAAATAAAAAIVNLIIAKADVGLDTMLLWFAKRYQVAAANDGRLLTLSPKDLERSGLPESNSRLHHANIQKKHTCVREKWLQNKIGPLEEAKAA